MSFKLPIPPYPVRSVWLRVHRRVNPVFFPTIHVNEFPKSGGTWLCRMLSDTLGYRFDDNVYRRLGPSITKSHYAGQIGPKTVIAIRDPRDVAVSYFHHVKAIFADDPFNSKSVTYYANNVFKEEASQRENLQLFTKSLQEAPRFPAVTWGQFYERALEGSVMVVKYEDLRAETAKTLTEVLTKLDLDPSQYPIDEVADSHNIEKILKKRGDDKKAHFIRKGKVGNWAEELDPDTVALVEETNREFMERFGYL